MQSKVNFYEMAKEEIRKTLENKGFYVEGGDTLSVSLTSVGLSSVYAEISEEEIKLYADQLETDYINGGNPEE